MKGKKMENIKQFLLRKIEDKYIFNKIKKDSISHNKYSNSYDMPNGDTVEVIND